MRDISLGTELERIISDIKEVSKYLWERGWAERNAGNLSVDITRYTQLTIDNSKKSSKILMKISQSELAGRIFFITPTNTRFRDLAKKAKENLLIIGISNDLEGYHILWGGESPTSRPTSELIPHLKIHGFMRRNDLQQEVVLHTHPTQLIALTHIDEYNNEKALNRVLWAMHPEVKIFIQEGIGFVPYRLPGSEALADETVRALETHRIVVWEKHGCLAIGSNVFEAFDLIDTANKAAEIFFMCKMAGYEPQGLSDEQLNELVSVNLSGIGPKFRKRIQKSGVPS